MRQSLHLLRQVLDEPVPHFITLLNLAVPNEHLDDLAVLLISYYEYISHSGAATKSRLFDVLKYCIDFEISTTADAGELFRGVGLHIKMVTSFFNMNGRDFLWRLVMTPLQYLCEDKSSYEMDPAKLESKSAAAKNAKKLRTLIDISMIHVQEESGKCPKEFCCLLSYIKSAVRAKFPGAERAVLSCIVFTRFLQPCLLTPEKYGLTLDIKQDQAARLSRNRMLFSKVLQNISSGVLFGDKEGYMTVANEIITVNESKMDVFLDTITLAPEGHECARPRHMPTVPLPEVCERILYTIFEAKPRIGISCVKMGSVSECFDLIRQLKETTASGKMPKLAAYKPVSTALTINRKKKFGLVSPHIFVATQADSYSFPVGEETVKLDDNVLPEQSDTSTARFANEEYVDSLLAVPGFSTLCSTAGVDIRSAL